MDRKRKTPSAGKGAVYRLIELAMLLSVATTIVERAFLAMKIIKTELRKKFSDVRPTSNFFRPSPLNETLTVGSHTSALEQEDVVSGFSEKVVMSTVFEEGDEEGEEKKKGAEVEVCKEVVEEESYKVDSMEQPLAEPDRTKRFQNIFRLCGNYHELVKKQDIETPAKQQVFGDDNKQLGQQLLGDEKNHPTKQYFDDENKDPSAWEAIETPISDVKVADSPVSSQLSLIVCQVVHEADLIVMQELKSCTTPEPDVNDHSKQKEREGLLEVYIKLKSGNLIKGLKLQQTACLSDLRKLIEAHFEEASNKKQHHQFSLLLPGDPSGVQVSREKESTVQISKLPNWNNQTNSYLAYLRTVKNQANPKALNPA